MNHWQKLGLPVALGICAAFLNWQSVGRKLEPREYVCVNKEIKPGQLITESDLEIVAVSHTDARLAGALVPSEKKFGLVGRYAQRLIEKGDLLTRFDTLPDNIEKLADDEVSVTLSQKNSPIFFVGERVNVLDVNRRPVEGWRVLSITPDEGTFEIQLAINKERLRILEEAKKINLKDLEIR